MCKARRTCIGRPCRYSSGACEPVRKSAVRAPRLGAFGSLLKPICVAESHHAQLQMQRNPEDCFNNRAPEAHQQCHELLARQVQLLSLPQVTMSSQR